jgi:hypothetical protein
MQHGNRGRGMPWAVSVPRSSFPDRQPDHYVFPFEHCGAKGEEDLFGFTGGVIFYDTDPEAAPCVRLLKSWGDPKLLWHTPRSLQSRRRWEMWQCSKCLKRMAPQVGLEPTTLRLTAECSAIELLRSV